MIERKHPETREGEMYLTNCYSGIFYDPNRDDEYYSIGWKTKRKGKVSYDNNGNIIVDLYPVFIQIEEYEAKHGKVIEWHHSIKENLLNRK